MEIPNWLSPFQGILISPDAARSSSKIAMVQAFPALWDRRSGDDPKKKRSTILLIDHEQDSTALPRVRAGVEEEEEAVILCYGPAGDEAWRDKLLAEGALACFSSATPLADQICLLRVAARHRALLSDLDHIRDESNRICQTLLESFGGANESLVKARGEAEQIREDLENVRERILRAFI